MKTLCPICSSVLLRHIGHSRILWFCLGCHQEMPNFDLVKFHPVQEKFRESNNDFEPSQNSCDRGQIDRSSQAKTIEYDSRIDDVLINQGETRLEVVGFILSQINLILINTFTETKDDSIEKVPQLDLLETSKSKASLLTIAYFIKDSELILLHICQAILIADSSLLSDQNFSAFISKSINLKYSIEQSYFIDLIKTLVIDFIHSISVDSSQSIYCFIAEVANYFEIVTSSIIEFRQSQESH